MDRKYSKYMYIESINSEIKAKKISRVMKNTAPSVKLNYWNTCLKYTY